MIIGTGVDIVDIRRFKKMYERHGDRLAERLLADAEWEPYRKHHKPYRYLASRFAAKEATVKAFGSGFGGTITVLSIATVSNENGAPKLQLNGGSEQKAKELGVINMHLSLSDEADYVVAMVILEK